MGLLNTILERALGAVFPERCVACGKSGKDFCLECISKIPPAERATVGWIFPLFDYRYPPIKKALWLLKYRNKKRLASIFAAVLYEKMMEELSELSTMENFRNPILIPIPLSRERRRERGYNQAELICRELIHLTPSLGSLGTPLSLTRRGAGGEVFVLMNNVLIKPKETEHQARIKNRRQRLKNIAGSFGVKNTELVKNKNIILIDDITTTGATLNEARKVLKKAGARRVIAFTVAH